jgi:hypothetical protein
MTDDIKRSLVSDALKRHGIEATPDDREVTILAGRRFEEDMSKTIWKYNDSDLQFGDEILVQLRDGDGYKVVRVMEGEDDDEGGCQIAYLTDHGRLHDLGAIRWARISDIEKL